MKEPILGRLRRRLRVWCLKNYGKEPWRILREAYLLAEKKKKEEKKEEEKGEESPIEELF